MARSQPFEKASQPFTEQPLTTPFTEESPVLNTSPAEPVTNEGAPVLQGENPSSAPTEPPPASHFFLSCLTEGEQQSFLDFCAMRGFSPEAGILAFIKEKVQRGELNSVVNNPFTDEAQGVVEAAQQQMHAPLQQGIAPNYQFGRKPTKTCEVCGEPFTIEFPGRMLCKKPECWHSYAGLHGQQQTQAVGQGETEVIRRVGKLETMMERVAAALDRLVGA